ncbi:MAG TPA: hypothetical protein VHO66_10505 [Ruminiclostridium sp.]|nr:hypothetical protein [Ruminiclostridium sp.]
MSKPNFFTVLITAFFILLGRLLSVKKEHRKLFFIKCITLLMCTLVLFGIRESVDFAYYGFDKTKIVTEMKEQKAGPEFKPSTPADKKFSTMQLHDRNVGLHEIFFERQFIQKSFLSFIGSYGYMQRILRFFCRFTSGDLSAK